MNPSIRFYSSRISDSDTGGDRPMRFFFTVLITFEDEDIYSYLDPRYHPGDPRDPTEPWGFYVDKCTLYVPEGTEWAYRNHPVFGVFKNIEIETKGKE